MIRKFIIYWLSRGGPDRALSRFSRLVSRYIASIDDAAGIKFLLSLDNKLYKMQGATATRAEGGIHPKHRLMKYHDFFTLRIQPDEQVLDIGCGHGALAHSIASQCRANVTAMDIAEMNIQMANERHRHEKVTFLLGDVLTDLPQQKYDILVMSNVLEHLEKRVEFLQQMQNQAQPERWLIRVPMFERDWRVPLKKELGLEWRLDSTHYTEYTMESFQEEIHKAGLLIDYLEVRWGEIYAQLVVAQ